MYSCVRPGRARRTLLLIGLAGLLGAAGLAAISIVAAVVVTPVSTIITPSTGTAVPSTGTATSSSQFLSSTVIEVGGVYSGGQPAASSASSLGATLISVEGTESGGLPATPSLQSLSPTVISVDGTAFTGTAPSNSTLTPSSLVRIPTSASSTVFVNAVRPPATSSVSPASLQTIPAMSEQEPWVNAVRGLDSDSDGVLDFVDNCPTVYNPDQLNSDGGRRPNGLGLPGEWASNPAQDKLGDACDPDNDNDGLPDAQEFDVHCPYRLVADSDGDHVPDGYEVANGFDPCSAASKPAWVSGGDSDGDGLLNGSERGYNTCASAGDTTPGWATCVIPQDSDGDGCSDNVEALDLNGDRTADSGDQGRLNRRVAGIIASDPVSDAIFDVNKDGFIDGGDQGRMNRNNCVTNPNQIGCPMCPPE